MENYEHSTNERYVKNVGSKVKTTGRYSVFDCSRSGFDKSKRFGSRNRMDKAQGSNKLNSRCPAQMIVLHKKDGCEITFYNFHTHDIEIRHVNLAEKTCEMIAGMLKAGFSEEYILDYYSEQPVNHRDHYVGIKDLKQIGDRYNLTKEWRAHSEDSKSVHLFVQQNSDKVIFYQPEIRTDEKITQEFILVLMTERQIKYVKDKKAFRFIFADATHNVGAKRKMATIMTVDDDEKGLALAFCFCQSESTSTMKTFFAAIRNKIGFIIKTDCFVSDDANAFFNAWCAEMKTDNPPHKRLCAWHVNKNWNAYLSQVPDDPVEPEMLDMLGKPITKRRHCKKSLFSLRLELDKDEFNIKLKSFLELLKSDNGYAKFESYFTNNYGQRVEQWAYTFLAEEGGYNTNMYLEAWHRVFKYKYLGGVHQNRLDFVLYKLIKFDKDQIEETVRSENFVIRRTKRTALTLKSHKMAQTDWKESTFNIHFEDCIDDGGIAKFILEKKKEQCTVTQISDNPVHKCSSTCPECNMCIHQYHCSCGERRIRRNYCVHLCALGMNKKLLFSFNQQEQQS